MTTGLSQPELDAFLDSVDRLLQNRCTESDVRKAMEARAGPSAELWAALAELGLPALLVDEAHGGLGAGIAVVERVAERLGAHVCPSPMLSVVLATALVQAAGNADVAARLLPAIAAGSALPAAAITGEGARWTAADVDVTATPAGNGWTLSGAARFVLDAGMATCYLVAARAGDGIGLYEVAVDAQGLSRMALPSFDRTLSLSDIGFANVAGVRLSADGDCWPAIERALDVARVALAGEQAGGARKIFEITCDYARTRHQFGRAIGSFQAVKHMAADLLLETESATSAARHAGAALAAGAADAGQAVSLAAFACADAYVRTAADAIQMHGGIGFTWEHPAHLFLRRARAQAWLLGSPAAMRERFIQQLGG